MYLAIDLETTGLDPVKNTIVEVAATLLNDDLTPVGGLFLCFHQIYWVSPIVWVGVDPIVHEMHTKTGLINASLTSEDYLFGGQHDFNVWMDSFPDVDWSQVVPFGSTIHFDRAFLKVWMPTVEKRLHYRSFDVSTLKMFFRSIPSAAEMEADAPKDRKLHSAKEDIEDSIAAAKYYWEAINAIQ
jgi:oligoribonuclease